jgi:3-deoxy-manno-octulosonate cytidylyltransferase (CMP-KDO synthetase)
MKVVALLPARLKSQRIKEKLLKKIMGIPVITHTILRAKLSKSLSEVIICTDSKKIEDCVKKHAKTFISKKKHNNGTERIAEIAKKIKADLIIDIHSDEAIIDPKNINKLISFHKKHKEFDIVVPHKVSKQSGGENIVKILVNKLKQVLYFTRSSAPHGFRKKNTKYLHHLDIISFKPSALKKFSLLKKSHLEIIEGIELMRGLENNLKIGSFPIKTKSFSINTPKDLFLAKKIMKKDKYFKLYENKK